jgi:hypothetical protein
MPGADNPSAVLGIFARPDKWTGFGGYGFAAMESWSKVVVCGESSLGESFKGKTLAAG